VQIDPILIHFRGSVRIRTRIFGTYIALGVVVLAAAGAMLFDRVRDEAREGIEARVVTGLGIVSAALEGWEGEADAARLDAIVDDLAEAADARLTVVAPDGTVLSDSELDGAALAAVESHAGRAEVREALASGASASVRYSRTVGADLLYRARRLEAGPWSGGVARMAVPMTRVASAESRALRALLVLTAVGLAITLLAGGLLARWLSGPIRELRAVAGRLTEGDLGARARVGTGDELEGLAAALNAAAAALGDQVLAARAERDQLEAVLEGMVEGVIVTDARGRVTLSNAALRRMFGLQGSAEGRTPIEALRNAEAADAIEESAQEGMVEREIRLTWPVERTLSLHVGGLATGGAVGVFHDITASKRVDEIRSDFVANVSHELQTPLSTLAGYGEALADSVGDPSRVREIAEVIRRQSARMSALVRDLLDLSRLESEGFVPQREPVDLDPLVREVMDTWMGRASAKGLKLHARLEPGLHLRADRRLLHQALSNLVENAVKYVPAGREVRIEARRSDDGIELVVADTGDGIPREDQPRVFERFYRVEKGRARTRGGTGLGLAIVKHVAEVHGGRVEVESGPGRGTTFRVILRG
jgi:two-component system phosphate regulon sensor histidine kinase PhoR